MDQALHDKLAKILRLADGGATEGERAAALAMRVSLQGMAAGREAGDKVSITGTHLSQGGPKELGA